MPNSAELDSFLAPYPQDVRDLALATRDLLAEVLQGATETIEDSGKLFGYAYGPGYKGLVCHLVLSKTVVKIGIARGSELPDPRHLLRGNGKIHRHVQLHEIADLHRPGLKRLLKAALLAWKKRNEVNG